jgi:hypothetical protein
MLLLRMMILCCCCCFCWWMLVLSDGRGAVMRCAGEVQRCLSQHTRCQQAGGESKRRLLCSFLLRHHFSAPGPTACAGMLHPAGRWGTTGRLAQLPCPCPLASLSLACSAWKNAPKPVSARRSALPATRTDIDNNTVLAREHISRMGETERAVLLLSACLLLLRVHVLLGASACYNCYELEPGARQSKAYTLLHVMYVLALHAQDNGCGNAAVF